MTAPTPDDLGLLLGQNFDGADEFSRAATALSIVTVMARSYTRGAGFTEDGPAPEIRAVILTAAARLLSNSKGLLYDESVGPESVSFRSAFTGWTTVERMALDRHRVRAL
ncbi:hypothetical protein [Mycolicibacterium palauense]|uniref:hypothetical protein n=1 Tax=Mycolicibacterium palauense TaxID=2034511 RepID=UPI000BFEDA87|nr:hypothetical protein [Mycolicibacterium palauense]